MTYSFESTAAQLGLVAFRPDVPGRFESLAGDEASSENGSTEADIVEAQERLRAEAFESGRAEGLASARTQIDPVLRALTAAASEFSAQRNDYLPAQRRLIVEIAVEIAERIIGRELIASPASIIERIAAALMLMDADPELVVELNPGDCDLASQAAESATLPEHFRFVENSRLARGDFLIISGDTTVDARITSLLEGTRRALAGLEALPATSGDASGGIQE